MKPRHGLEILSVPLWRGATWLELQTADHVEDSLLAEHDFEEGVLVQQEDVAEDLVEMVQPLHILEVLREHVRLVDCQNLMRWGFINCLSKDMQMCLP